MLVPSVDRNGRSADTDVFFGCKIWVEHIAVLIEVSDLEVGA